MTWTTFCNNLRLKAASEGGKLRSKNELRNYSAYVGPIVMDNRRTDGFSTVRSTFLPRKLA